MQSEAILVYKVGGRYKTATYEKEGSKCFCIAESTMKGVLLTEFEEGGAVVNQAYRKSKNAELSLKDYLGNNLAVKDASEYEKVVYKTPCPECSGALVRELDLKEPGNIGNVPVVPIFTCAKCSKRFYSMTDRYLRMLVNENQDLFEGEELKEKEKDIDAFINTLNEYIVRVFASKKIGRLK